MNGLVVLKRKLETKSLNENSAARVRPCRLPETGSLNSLLRHEIRSFLKSLIRIRIKPVESMQLFAIVKS